MGVVETVRLVEPLRMVPMVNGSATEGGLGRILMENDHSQDIVPKCKRRKVSAVRDFPPGCGRFAPPINLIQKEDIAGGDSLENLAGGDNTADISRNDCTSQSPRAVQGSIPTETLGQTNDLDPKVANPEAASDQVDGLESIGVEPVSELPEALEGLDDSGSNGPLKISELETSELLKDPHPVNVPASEEQFVLPRRSPDARPIAVPNGNCLEKHLGKSYPPRGRVSAVRDFPPFCGRNAPRLRSSTEVESSGQENTGLENKSVEETKKTGGEQIGVDIEGGDSHKSKLEENVLKVTGDEAHDTEAMMKLDELVEKIIKPPCESDRHSKAETVVEKGNVDVEGSEKNAEKEIMIYSEKNCPKRKLSDISGSQEQRGEEDYEGLGVTSRKLIVQGLKAAPNSLGKQEKVSCKLNWAGVTSENKGKKHAFGSLEKSKYASGLKSMKMNSLTVGKAKGHNSEAMGKQDEFATSSKMKAPHGDETEKSSKRTYESNQYFREETVVENGNTDVGGLQKNQGKEIVIYSEKRSPEGKLYDISGSQEQLEEEDYEGLEVASGRIVVHRLAGATNSLGRQGKIFSKLYPHSDTSGNKGKKHALGYLENSEHAVRRKKDESKDYGGKPMKMTSQLVVWSEDFSEDDEALGDFHVAVRPRNVNVSLPPFGHSDSSSKINEHDGLVTRNKVRETLRLFQAVCRKLLQEEEAKSKEQGNTRKRVDLQASKILKDKGKYINTGKQILGSVPGVEVGDEFHYRVELNIIGVHRQIQGGIDYVKQGREVLATSIVASGGYADVLDNSDFLIYTGQGGNVMGGDKEPEDQKLERGNLALKNSISAKNPVRVIRGFKDTKVSDSSDARGRPVVIMTYVYDGLYLVEKSWQDVGPHGKLVFKFKLVRIPGQPELAWKQVKKSNKTKVREGLCDIDISRGKEIIPICAVNTIDDEKPPPFEYITSMIYPYWCRPIPPKGCDCTKGCSDSGKCCCAIMNGGEIPYNYNGAIVEAKPLVYECGPSCKCPPSCPNRVSQRGIKFQLEIFKTESRGWGVRSLNSIPSGNFICEYAGELLEEKEADERTGNDEYLFDIGTNYNDTTFWGELSTLMPDAHSGSRETVEDGCFTIDAARYGNVGRFINHSCSPNLYAQNVLYDHEDRRVPHIMLFSAENIPPLQELTYHYNYAIDQVRDSNGNIKKKSCYCGAADCIGRMY